MIYAAGDQDAMMEESQEAAMRREELVRMYHTCNEALALIRDVSTKTGTGMIFNPPSISMIPSLSLQSTLRCPLQCSMTMLQTAPSLHLPGGDQTHLGHHVPLPQLTLLHVL